MGWYKGAPGLMLQIMSVGSAYSPTTTAQPFIGLATVFGVLLQAGVASLLSVTALTGESLTAESKSKGADRSWTNEPPHQSF